MVSRNRVYIYHPEVKGLTFSVKLLVCVIIVTLVLLAALDLAAMVGLFKAFEKIGVE